MEKLSETQKKINAKQLERLYPGIKDQLSEHENLLAVSKRKPMNLAGFFCILVGVVFAMQISYFYLLKNPLWAIPAEILSIALIWAGVWLTRLIRGEYIIITNLRLLHKKVNIFGKYKKTPLTIPLSDIAGYHLFKGTVMYRPMTNTIGDILIKKNDGRSHLIPTLKDGVSIIEALVMELPNHRNG